jgi:hypothetical protein
MHLVYISVIVYAVLYSMMMSCIVAMKRKAIRQAGPLQFVVVQTRNKRRDFTRLLDWTWLIILGIGILSLWSAFLLEPAWNARTSSAPLFFLSMCIIYLIERYLLRAKS